ncbi:lauroyl acyltransferase [Stappia sp. F7233]|uniref:Lauroyl acyltransferase n=1 Tax=Stappia albiluteola TaxID=2758565 RepID=A0A839AAU9_9HYPH|nr:lauroyl acyltransferase [Stappia albiluteola]MBA5776790.1 lauroyl acyltransferase [Stappia albiluteola]
MSPPRRGAALKSLQYRLEWLALKSALGVIRLLPLDAASWLGGRIWRVVAPFNARHRRAVANLQAAFPEKSPQECDAIARDMWENLGRVMAETLQLDRLAADPSRFAFDIGPAERAFEGKGSIIVSMHSGNWEVCALGGLAAGRQPAGVYQALKNPLADELLKNLRAPIYPAGLFSKGHDTARRLMAIARGGGMVAFLADLRDVRGIRVPFFGREAHATPFPASLARGSSLPLIASRVVRLKGARFRIEARPVAYPVTGDRKADITAATALVHRQFEEWIRENPSQWMWIHRKWV